MVSMVLGTLVGVVLVVWFIGMLVLGLAIEAFRHSYHLLLTACWGFFGITLLATAWRLLRREAQPFSPNLIQGGAFALMVVAGVMYGFGAGSFPETSFRFRMTIDVMTPLGKKTGSSIVELKRVDNTISKHMPRWIQSGARFEIAGTAPIVDLGAGGWLMVPLAGDPKFNLMAAPKRFFGDSLETLSVLAAQTRPRTLEREEWPLVVWAPPQASNGKSLMRINPDLLPQLSGVDVRVERIVLTPTTERAPTRLAARTSWLDALRRDRVTYHSSNQSVILADLERRR